MNGDKLSTLHYLFTLSQQHGMYWVGTGLMPANQKASKREDLNYLASFSGLMTAAPADAGGEQPLQPAIDCVSSPVKDCQSGKQMSPTRPTVSTSSGHSRVGRCDGVRAMNASLPGGKTRRARRVAKVFGLSKFAANRVSCQADVFMARRYSRRQHHLAHQCPRLAQRVLLQQPMRFGSVSQRQFSIDADP